MEGKSMIDNCAETGDVTHVLSESARCQYLNAMGIQTWFDPSLKVSSTEVVLKQDKEASVTEPHNPAQIKSEPVASINPKETHLEKTEIKSTGNLQALTTQIEQCQLCELHTTRKQAICGEGSDTAGLLIIIDAPVSDVTGDKALFNALDKQMLQAMLQTIGINLSAVYITSLVKCLPPEQRAPQTSEMICCDDYLTAQIKLIKPKAIMVSGEQASQQLLLSQKSLTDLRLRHHQHLGIPVYASYHPRELFNSSETKRKVWADLLQISKHF